MESPTRPLTQAERGFLQREQEKLSGGSVGVEAGCAGVGAGCFTLPVLVAVTAIFSTLPERTKILLVAGFFAVFWAGWFFFLWRSRRRERARTADERRAVESDLAGGVAALHRFRATAVIRLTSARQQRRDYFVRLDDGRVLFLGGWGVGRGPEAPPYGPEEKGFPSAEFELATGPETRLILDVVGCGEFLRPEDEFKSGFRKPKLKSGDFVPTPWEEIRQTYG